MVQGEAVNEVWSLPPRGVALGADEVHVWRAWLEPDPVRDASLAATLSPDEKARAAQFRQPGDAAHYVRARGILRDILARYLGEPPADLRFSVGPTGKPFLVGRDAVHFNLSHSADLALYAVARGGEVGVDVEAVRHDVDHDTLAQRFFSPGEREQLRRLPESARQEAFFTCWVRKEAFLKATGEGLSVGLASFDVLVLGDAPPGRQVVRDGRGKERSWSVAGLHPAPGYAAAVAVEDGQWRMSCWHWSKP